MLVEAFANDVMFLVHNKKESDECGEYGEHDEFLTRIGE